MIEEVLKIAGGLFNLGILQDFLAIFLPQSAINLQI